MDNRNYNRNNNRQNTSQIESEYFEKVVQVNRVSKKTKGGDKRSLSVIVVVGDKNGKVGVGLGKAGDVRSAVAKAGTYAKKHFIDVPRRGRTIPHSIMIKLGAARVLLRPAPVGTGVIAGGAVRVVVEAAGIHDIVSKILGTKNRASNVYATLEALKQLKKVKEPVVEKSEPETKKEGKKK
jgi:small subunit ribosomal protein S5